jgi:GH24 family phage-related lysozyme (muramidase)
MLDQGDPTVTTLLGDTPGPLGFNDWASPDLPNYFDLTVPLLGGQAVGTDGIPISLGSLGPVCRKFSAFETVLNWDQVRADLELWEGKISHMYLDSKGLVTVGIGKMLPNVAAAQALGFVNRENQMPASAVEIKTDFDEVFKQAKGKIAATYKKYTKLDLPDAEIDKLLKSVVDGFEADLNSKFAGYKIYPVSAKRALLDMIYNLGLAGLLEYKKLKAAAELGDWGKAADECHRNGPSDKRNEWTRKLFLQAANE